MNQAQQRDIPYVSHAVSAAPQEPAQSTMLIGIDERPPLGQSIILAIQHVFAMFGATVLVPILVAAAVGEEVLSIPVALAASGIGTLIYALCTKSRSPVYLGSSFAFIAPIAAAYAFGGISGAMTGIMLVGLIYAATALLIHLVGKDWLDRILPPVVYGPMIMVIGLGLASSAIGQIGLTGIIEDWRTVIVALITLFATAVIAISAGGFLKIVPVLAGLVIGYITAAIVGLVDFAPIIEAPFFALPQFVFPFVHYTPNLSAALTMAPIALVTMSEHIGDHKSLSQIIGKDLIHDPGLDRTLLGDGLATIAAGLIGGPANTTYGENTSVVGMTKVASTWVIKLAACFAIGLAFLGKFAALVSSIPNPVLGGVSVLLYGFIATNGLKPIKYQVNIEDMRNMVIISTMLIIGIGSAAITLVNGNLTVTFSGMSLSAILGVTFNLILPHEDTFTRIKAAIVRIMARIRRWLGRN